MSTSVANSATNKTKFWIVCCQATEVTQQISKAVSEWQLPGVRSLLCDQICDQTSANQPSDFDNIAQDVAQSDYAIFITPCDQPSVQIKVSPLGTAQNTDAADQSPAALLTAIHDRHERSPQSWWFQLPTTEVRAQKVRPVAVEKSVAQALNQIEVFVRNYRLAIAPKAINDSAKAPEAGGRTSVRPYRVAGGI